MNSDSFVWWDWVGRHGGDIRAATYEMQGKSELAIGDLRQAVELKPKSVFETLAQGLAKAKLSQLTKSVPCSSGMAKPGEQCL